MPPDSFMARGTQGQYIVIVPSARLVVVRLGMAHDRYEDIDGVAGWLRMRSPPRRNRSSLHFRPWCSAERVDPATADGSDQRRLAFRNERVRTLVSGLKAWMRAERARLLRQADLAKGIDYMLKRWPAFTRFSTMAASAYRTMPPSALCAASLPGAAHGCSPALTEG
jgi:hypothetical protein